MASSNPFPDRRGNKNYVVNVTGMLAAFMRPAHLVRSGAAVAAGVVLGLDAPRMTSALNVAGSLECGLMEFAALRH